MNSLKAIVDSNVNEVINEIRLTLKPGIKKTSVFILVEGIDDTRIYPKFFLTENVLFRSVGGKGNLRNAMQTLAALTTQVIAIRDADFAHLRGNKPEFDAIFFTDKHDIEMTMLSLQEVLINAFAEFRLQDRAIELLEAAMREAEYISYIRWVDADIHYGLDFNFGIAFFIKSGKTKQDLLYTLNSRSKEKTKEITEADVESFVECHRTVDYYNLCNGHDIFGFLSLYIGNETSQKEIAKIFRSSFHWRHFSQTNLYNSLKEWQMKHGFTILKTGEGTIETLKAIPMGEGMTE
jgi:hypothetical protein